MLRSKAGLQCNNIKYERSIKFKINKIQCSDYDYKAKHVFDSIFFYKISA